MIRINLLPTKAARKKETLVQQLIIAVVLIAVMIVACFLDLKQQKKELAILDSQIAKIKSEIRKLQSVIKEVESYKKDKQELERKINAIKDLQRRRSGPVKVMDELTTIIPRKLWLSSFKETGKNVTIDGAATDGITISNFLQKLIDSKYFNGVHLIKVTQGNQKGMKVLQFTIRCTVNYSA